MESNRDDAAKAFRIAQSKLERGDVAAALRFARKSVALYPSEEVEGFLLRVQRESASGTNSTSGTEHASASNENQSEPLRRRKNKSPESNGSQKAYTSEQKAVVDRICKYKRTQYYEILDISKKASDGEIKKSYRRLALLLHPDKNNAPGADEAFKMVSKAFQVLSDSNKRSVYDQSGGDPDSLSSRMPSGSPFGNGYARTSSMGGDDISAEDLFNMFFGGGAQMNSAFGNNGFGGPSFGGPGIRVHTFGNRPRRQARPDAQDEGQTSRLLQMAPLLVILFVTIISSLLSSDDGSPGVFQQSPAFQFEPVPPYTELRHTPQHNIPFYVDSAQVSHLSGRKLRQLDSRAEVTYVRDLQSNCQIEWENKQRRVNAAYGWFGVDKEALDSAQQLDLKHCHQLERLGYRLR